MKSCITSKCRVLLCVITSVFGILTPLFCVATPVFGILTPLFYVVTLVSGILIPCSAQLLTCSNSLVLCAVIGRGGEQITRLQRDSGAKIQMAQDSQGRAERSCTLSGSR